MNEHEARLLLSRGETLRAPNGCAYRFDPHYVTRTYNGPAVMRDYDGPNWLVGFNGATFPSESDALTWALLDGRQAWDGYQGQPIYKRPSINGQWSVDE